MSRLIPHTDMSAFQLQDCGYQAQAIISVCRIVVENIPSNDDATRIGADVEQALAVAYDLVGIVHDALMSHEGLKGGAK